jgi:molybdopterin-guanine dinucleotide biosynthesis protein A
VGRTPEFDTVVLAGGGSARMGGADKPGLAVGGTPMLISVAQAAAAAGTSRLIIVGPVRVGSVQDALAALARGRIGWLASVQEEPAGSGPVAALRRGLAEAGAARLLLLAADLPFLTAAHVTVLLTADGSRQRDAGLSADGKPAGAAGVVAADANGRPQWLVSCWRTAELRSALAGYDGSSLRGLLGPLEPVLIRLAAPAGAPPPWLDCDTPDDLAAARRAWLTGLADAEADS